jgi:hypothetical protein
MEIDEVKLDAPTEKVEEVQEDSVIEEEEEEIQESYLEEDVEVEPVSQDGQGYLREGEYPLWVFQDKWELLCDTADQWENIPKLFSKLKSQNGKDLHAYLLAASDEIVSLLRVSFCIQFSSGFLILNKSIAGNRKRKRIEKSTKLLKRA